MQTKNKILLEYFRELVGTINIKELVENETLATKAKNVMSRFESMND